MDKKTQVLNIIFRSMDNINKFLPKEKKLKKQPAAILWDEETGGNLDSLGMINFIVVLEEEISKELGVTLMLADDLIITSENNPFQSAEILSDNICDLLN